MAQSSKDPGPEDPALFHPRGVEFALDSEWNNGMVEKWNIGNQKRMTV